MLYIEKTSSTDKKIHNRKNTSLEMRIIYWKTPCFMHVNMLAKVEIAIARPDLHL